MNRADMIAAVTASRSPAFLSEVSFHVHGIDDREYAYDEISALFDIEERNQDSDGNKTLLREARRILIEIGFYRVMPESEQRQTFSTSGTVWAFRLNGSAYTTDHIADDWQWPDGPSK